MNLNPATTATDAAEQGTMLRHTPLTPLLLDEIGIPEGLIEDLMLRRLYRYGRQTLTSLSERLKLSLPIVEGVFDKLRQRHLIEVLGMEGDDYRFSLSQGGHDLANERLRVSEYAGAAPVSLSEYVETVRAQSIHLDIDRDKLRQAYNDIVTVDDLLDQLGPALVAQTSLFLYGPSGNGKTTLAERMLRLYEDVVLVPYALEVDGQITTIYDPTVHHAVDIEVPNLDPRWAPCRRPCITVGGELKLEMLDLRRDAATGVYTAPLQLKANNGMLLIDDFGRQAISPTQLLNRWIVPLDRRVDYLSLHYGVSFEMPFELMVVFSTNLDPLELADEAFLRRLPNKVFIGPVGPEVFDEIFAREVDRLKLKADLGSAATLRELSFAYGATELRACYPRDVCEKIVATGVYEGTKLVVNRASLERAVQSYFTRKA